MSIFEGDVLYPIEETVLADPSNEEQDSLNYYFNASAHLLNILHSDEKLRESPLFGQVYSLVEYWDAAPERRNKTKRQDAAMDVHLFGTVGKALWYLWKRGDPQLMKEIGRLAYEPEALVGTHYLFYIAGTLASQGCRLTFVPEKGEKGLKTPDLLSEKDAKKVWIEANAKQPVRDINTPEKIWQMIRDIIEEKSQKFSDPMYTPGMIVADISPAAYYVNETGTQPLIKLREDLLHLFSDSIEDGYLYRLYEDPAWGEHRENQGNVIAYLVDEFSRIDRSRYHVYQCLITITRRVVVSGDRISFPKRHLLVVHRDAESTALTEIARHVYSVESRPPL